jgi:hypothetical protein
MRPEHFPAQKLVSLFKNKKIASMTELKEALGTEADITVLRKLAELSYHSSYSHRGGYYTLKNIPQWDHWGLWSFRSVWFSKRGTLIDTAEHLVVESEAGFFASELEDLLHVEVKGCLLRLVRQERIAREKFLGRYLYCASAPDDRRQQLHARRICESQMTLGGPLVAARIMPDELKAAIILFFSLLNEQQRRLYAGLESLKLGHGGDQQIADLLGLDRGTVAKGRQALLEQDVLVEQVRKRGGGRKPVEKKLRKSSPGSKS